MAMALSIMREVVASLKLDVSRPLTLVSIKWNELNNNFIRDMILYIKGCHLLHPPSNKSLELSK